eukprot:CAMPEP_0119359396 /NCGR_PEP_ID=MMETSP1334-20130426/7297_1 /TAXON_ID=127549 /ORGANISM="Calcidiscus leptoporus, Strain RCC1130" /LENGTH=169 /DNA_ID=CAMNT_0007374061 /DNA_START=228 /DNA_END=737 /DNA_ORIENTATION=+
MRSKRSCYLRCVQLARSDAVGEWRLPIGQVELDQWRRPAMHRFERLVLCHGVPEESFNGLRVLVDVEPVVDDLVVHQPTVRSLPFGRPLEKDAKVRRPPRATPTAVTWVLQPRSLADGAERRVAPRAAVPARVAALAAQHVHHAWPQDKARLARVAAINGYLAASEAAP